MTLQEYKKTITAPLKQTTLCFLAKEDLVLLAMKKRGFGTGKYNGIGGKKDPHETIEETAKRETNEEIGVVIEKLEHAATLKFYYPNNPHWHQQVFVYLIDEWQGEPEESEEMKPQWFEKTVLPFERMWPDDKHWLPLVLEGEFLFGKHENILDYQLS